MAIDSSSFIIQRKVRVFRALVLCPDQVLRQPIDFRQRYRIRPDLVGDP